MGDVTVTVSVEGAEPTTLTFGEGDDLMVVAVHYEGEVAYSISLDSSRPRRSYFSLAFDLCDSIIASLRSKRLLPRAMPRDGEVRAPSGDEHWCSY